MRSAERRRPSVFPAFAGNSPERDVTGDRGVEPRVAVLETAVLPIHQSPGIADCTAYLAWNRRIEAVARRPAHTTAGTASEHIGCGPMGGPVRGGPSQCLSALAPLKPTFSHAEA